jgi:saccharopine dehydrogenase-like NADP-dependent oxidoreductase
LNILVFGAGQIGKCVAFLLANLGNYKVFLADKFFDNASKSLANLELIGLDALDHSKVIDFIKNNNIVAVCSCLPYFCNLEIARAVVNTDSAYFDLTEDFQDANKIREIFTKSFAFTQCGLAPGYVDMLVHNIAKDFEVMENVEVRTGALSSKVDNVLKHSCAWSVDGLINEYVKDAECIIDSNRVVVPGLSRLSTDVIFGQEYEMFSTSGGIGGLVRLLEGRANNIEYKTIRYPGHCEVMLSLLDEYKLRSNLQLLRELLLHVMHPLDSDKVLLDIKINGKLLNGGQQQARVSKVFVSKVIVDKKWLAIQWTTAASVCAMIDLFLNEKLQNVDCQDQLDLAVFSKNKFGRLFLDK